MNEKILVILRGLPGSGKTSFAKELTEDLKKKGISTTTSSTDDYWYDDEGNYLFDPYFLRDAHEWNQNRVRQDLKANVSVVIVDNCNMAPLTLHSRKSSDTKSWKSSSVISTPSQLSNTTVAAPTTSPFPQSSDWQPPSRPSRLTNESPNTFQSVRIRKSRT